MIYTEVVNKLSLGITVKLGIIMFASYIVVQVIEECVSYFQIYLNTVLQLKLGQSVSHEINNKLAKVKLNSLEMYEIHDLVSRANQTIKSSIVSSLNLIIALYTPLATIVLQLASLVWVAWYVPILIAVFNVPYIFILVKSNHRRYELERKITKEKRVEKYFVELLSDRYAAKDIRTYDLVNFFFSKMIDVKEKIALLSNMYCSSTASIWTLRTNTCYSFSSLLYFVVISNKFSSVLYRLEYMCFLEKLADGLSYGHNRVLGGNIRLRRSHSNSIGNKREKDTAGCCALNRKDIVIEGY